MKAYHVLVVGDSGGGKTSLGREIHANSTKWVSVWINHSGEMRVPGVDVSGVSSLREAVQSGEGVIHYKTGEPERALTEVRSVAYHETTKPVQVIVDEAATVMPEESPTDNPLRRILHEDRDMGLRAVCITQDPSELPYKPLKQVPYWVWCGQWAGLHDGFLNAHTWIDRADLPTENYHYIVMDKRGTVLYRGETKEEFA